MPIHRIKPSRPWLSKLPRSFLDAVLPPRCPVTGTIVAENFTLAPEYWSQLTFLQKPMCACCGNPFTHDLAADMLCGSCMTERPLYERARAVLKYDDASARMILKFKHADGTHLAPLLSKWLQQAGAEILSEAHLLVPVPLHRWRLLKRRYNQAALLTQYLSATTNVAAAPFLLRRVRHTESQGHKSKTQRLENIHGAFAVSPKIDVTDKNIVIIDDVLTSGATVNECTKALLKAGANRVDVLTVARVVYNT